MDGGRMARRARCVSSFAVSCRRSFTTPRGGAPANGLVATRAKWRPVAAVSATSSKPSAARSCGSDGW
eukprot:5655047-Prymnesium_polylepis.2